MAYKERTKPHELRVLEILNSRSHLSPDHQQYLYNLKKGYEGELAFDQRTEELQCDCLILNDLLLKEGQTTFQIDSLIIMSGKLYIFDVKNHEGNHYFESDKFFKMPNYEISNPLHQLNRCESLLRKLLQKSGYSLSIESFVVFINSTFTLYNAPRNPSIILPTQIHQFLAQLDSTPSKITQKHRKLADTLISLHIDKYPYSQPMDYNYANLAKGISCPKCYSLSTILEGRYCGCKNCGHKEVFATAIMRSVEEFQTLFPDEKITTNKIYDWCKIVPVKKRIRRVLSKNLRVKGVRQWTYYEKMPDS
ncbi:NERD domain-containing protein [Virgibacillus sp. MSP4-1]|uniref:nuclease-related domain-containing protein n=1 Tax=Virgibacillus sp. MSP4-1 TaxID=2700081 RepID=UPI00039F6B81|nr:nuclease-related domain-containing protein [Virgibacillus sp. MSP4-1]QHS23777.1 NERD domain-containing protein [Virgibacillus sp. MSP4-1]